MKKKIYLLIAMCMMILPFTVLAEEKESLYTIENLEDVLTRKKVEHDLSGYEETEEQVPVYLFYGENCGFCEKFIVFLNSIVKDYGEYFRLEAYEVSDRNNNDLMTKVARFMRKDAGGVPLIVIGDKAFTGYSSSYDKEIKKAITDQYEKEIDDRYDVLKEMENPSPNKDWVAVVIIGVVILIGIGGLVYIARKN